MGTRHDRDDLLAAAVGVALTDGLDGLTFGRLGKQLGVSDRMLVYYFHDKEGLLTSVIEHISRVLVAGLAEAFGRRPRPVDDLLQTAWPVLLEPRYAPTFALAFELFGQAAAGHEPHRRLAADLVRAWHAWLVPLVDAPTLARRKRDAMAVLALVEGTFLLRAVLGDDRLLTRAARSISVADPSR